MPAVTHLLFVAAIRLIGVPAPSGGRSRAPMSPFTAYQQLTFHPDQGRDQAQHHHFPSFSPAEFVSALLSRVSPDTSMVLRYSAVWMEFPQDHVTRPVAAHRLAPNLDPPEHSLDKIMLQKKNCVSCAERQSSLISLQARGSIGTTPWAVGDCGLNISAEASMRTPQFHQPHLLWEPSS